MLDLQQGDCLEVMQGMQDNCVQTCVTSPPYWGLRDYGVDGQLGLEKSPDEYVAKMVEVFREVRRVLKDDGTLWLNLGDSYGHGTTSNRRDSGNGLNSAERAAIQKKRHGGPSKQLIGIPWRVAFALQADGWYLRSDIIWHKPNPMPESVTDRPTKAHEYIFLFAKSERYFYDADAIRTPFKDASKKRVATGWAGDENRGFPESKQNNMRRYMGTDMGAKSAERGANRRTVWTVTTKSFKGAHFATFPPDLIEPCILAGCPAGGTVLDPFAGAGTTGLVAKKHGRAFIGIELNPQYLAIAEKRIAHYETETV